MTQVAEQLREEALQEAPAASAVSETRADIVNAVRNPDDYFISVDGPCALIDTPELTLEEAQHKVANAVSRSGYLALDRECFFKPRSNPDRNVSWHGLDTTDPRAAQAIIGALADRHANVVAEVTDAEQLDRYGESLSMIWIGSRNVERTDLVEELAETVPDVVIGVKNGLDGKIDKAIEQVERIERLRGPAGAPALLIYRGGDNAKTPEDSRRAYIEAHAATNGRIGADTAHGTEMAYDPTQRFQKSIVGQILASEALVRMSELGYAPLLKISEASAVDHVVDPHMDLRTALKHSRLIHAAKLL